MLRTAWGQKWARLCSTAFHRMEQLQSVQLTGAQHNIQFINIKGSNIDFKKSVINTCQLLRSVLKQPCCSGVAGGKVSLVANWSWSPNRESGIRQNRERVSPKVRSTAVRENFLQGRGTSLFVTFTTGAPCHTWQQGTAMWLTGLRTEVLCWFNLN